MQLTYLLEQYIFDMSVEKSEMKLRMYLFVCVWEKFTRIHGNLLIIKDDFQR